MMATMADGLKERENLYKLMISQLRYDGFEAIASNLAKVVNIISACPPMARLHQVVNLGIQAETEGVKPEQPVIPGLTPSVETKRGIDLEYEPEGNDLTGEWYSSSTSDESFMNNLKLQKVDQESGGERNDKADDAPSVNTVLHHILRITSDKKLSSEPLQFEKPATDSKPLTPNGDVLDAESICEQVKVELVKYNVSQEVFAKAVLGKSQGYLSEMLKHGESFFRPHDNTHYKGWLNFDTMRRFLLKPEEERLMIYQSKGEELKMERLKRRQIEIGLTEDPSKKKRRLIPMEAKAVMEDYYHRNKYLSTNNRQCLANQLAIPEQCISDYFKNLRSRKKHEERMKNLLQDLENGHKQLDQVDSDTAEGSLEDEMDDQLPSCSENLSAAAIRDEPPPQARPPSQIKHSGRRYNVAPFQEPPAKNVSETDLVASKIAALTQSQKSPHKDPGTVQALARRDSNAHQRVTALDHFPSREDSRREACNCPPSQPSSSGADAEERFSLDSLFNGSMMELQGGTTERETLEVGQQIYVVHLNNHVQASIQD